MRPALVLSEVEWRSGQHKDTSLQVSGFNGSPPEGAVLGVMLADNAMEMNEVDDAFVHREPSNHLERIKE